MAPFHITLIKREASPVCGGKTVGKNTLCSESHCHYADFSEGSDLIPWLAATQQVDNLVGQYPNGAFPPKV